jgi:hypothetical protein
MIEEIYINEAKRIREEYLKNLIYIAKEEDNIKTLTNDLETLGNEIENSDSKSENYYRDALFEVEVMIRKATDKILPYHDKVKELDKQQRKLYNTLKDKYPNISDEEIRSEIIPHIIEIDDKYKEQYQNLLK